MLFASVPDSVYQGASEWTRHGDVPPGRHGFGKAQICAKPEDISSAIVHLDYPPSINAPLMMMAGFTGLQLAGAVHMTAMLWAAAMLLRTLSIIPAVMVGKTTSHTITPCVGTATANPSAIAVLRTAKSTISAGERPPVFRTLACPYSTSLPIAVSPTSMLECLGAVSVVRRARLL